MSEVSIIGLDLAKNVSQAHGTRSDGSIAFRMKISRAKLIAFSSAPRCVVAMEACGGAHHWAREIGALGHEVRLIAPIYVKPFVKRNKNDAADAEAIAEAASRPTMRFVAVKSVEKQATGMAFKTRDLLVRQRTQAINALRGHMAEYGSTRLTLSTTGGRRNGVALARLAQDGRYMGGDDGSSSSSLYPCGRWRRRLAYSLPPRISSRLSNAPDTHGGRICAWFVA